MKKGPVAGCLKLVTMAFLSLALLTASVPAPALSSGSIARVTAFEGMVYVQSGIDLVTVSRVGQRLDADDRLQTLAGSVWLRFDNGAVLGLQPFSSAMIQEREEKHPWWFFFSTRAVRRITCIVGKLRFKSARVGKKNFLQTPTAVIGLRGSEGEIGFDNLKTSLNLISGQTDTVGMVERGAFENPGPAAAPGNPGFQTLEKARQIYVRARAAEDEGQLKQARLMVATSMRTVGQSLEGNPDPTVSNDGTRQKEAANDLIDKLSSTEANTAPDLSRQIEVSQPASAHSNTTSISADQTTATAASDANASPSNTAESVESAPEKESADKTGHSEGNSGGSSRSGSATGTSTGGNQGTGSSTTGNRTGGNATGTSNVDGTKSP